VGRPQYMSPEQVASSKVDGRSDLYSAGIMFYELVVGQPPFTASDADGPFTLMAKHVQAPPKPPSVFRPGLNPELEQIILKPGAKKAMGCLSLLGVLVGLAALAATLEVALLR